MFFFITFAVSIYQKTIDMLGTQEIIVIALIILLLFGGKKIPELMKGLGKGVKSFKDGVNGIEKDITPDIKQDAAPANKQDDTPVDGNNSTKEKDKWA